MDKWDCSNCDKVFEHTYSNGGLICTGMVSETYRNCDVIRICQKYDDGEIYKQDISLDEAFVLSSAIQLAATNYLKFVYQRPCENCPEVGCESDSLE